ncbi:MAG: hypothetical protein IMF07_06125 [Proteobacteria bacterium]|nr:hypothetical protein [Pseudomonadota bacterium]
MLLAGLIACLIWDILAYGEYLVFAIEHERETAEKLPEEAKWPISQIKNK